MYKAFDPRLHAQNDAKAKQVISEFILRHNNEVSHVEINSDKYGVDLLLYDDSHLVGYAECEVKRVWNTEVFPWTSVQVPERKQKFAHVLSLPVQFYVLNVDYTKVIVISKRSLLQSPLCHVSNKYVPVGEVFYQVPLSEVEIFNL